MTVAAAWVGKRRDGREHLWVAADSRVRGGHILDACPKIFTLPRSDSVLCFAGNTAAAYPMMLQVAHAISAHEPSRDRSMDVLKLQRHVVRVLNDIVSRFRELPVEFETREVQFLLAGYSWRKCDFRIWTIDYRAGTREFAAREATSFHPRLRKAAFVGDRGTDLRSRVWNGLLSADRNWNLEPLNVLARMVAEATPEDSIGGAPQVVRVAAHMNTRVFIVRWEGADTLFGRSLFAYESVDYWIIDPLTGETSKPRGFGVHAPADTTEIAGSEPVDSGSTPEVT